MSTSGPFGWNEFAAWRDDALVGTSVSDFEVLDGPQDSWHRDPDAEPHAPSGSYEGVGDDNPYCA